MPEKLPDLFEGDQLVLLGQYVGKSAITFKISGNYLGSKRQPVYDSFEALSRDNGFDVLEEGAARLGRAAPVLAAT